MTAPQRGRSHPRLRRFATLGALAALLVAIVAGCGGSGGGGTETADETVASIETACTKLNGVTVWLPEHLAKEDLSLADGERIVSEAEGEFRDSIADLSPPDDLKAPVEDLLDLLRAEPPTSKASAEARFQQLASAYGAIGADRCRAQARAADSVLGGESVEGAYRKLGIELPPHPDGW